MRWRGIFAGLGAVLFCGNTIAAPAVSAVSYQGHLVDSGLPANGIYDLSFALFDAPMNGQQIGPGVTNSSLLVSNGLFTASLDFGIDSFNGDARWLEIAVRSGTNDFALLSPRQPLTAAPYALAALNQTPLAAATNDLNLALSMRISVASNDVSQASFATTIASTNDLNSVVCLKIIASTNALWAATTNWVPGQGFQTTNSPTRKPLTIPGPVNGTNYVLDFANEVVQVMATNNVNIFQSTNRTSSGWYGESLWHIQGGAANQLLSVNPGWTPVGVYAASMPCILVSNKLTLVAFSVRGPGETNVVYAISRQE